MSKNSLLAGGALLASAALAFSSAASAGITFVPLGPLLPAGYTVITDFNTIGLGTLSGLGVASKTQSGIVTGTYSYAAAPALSTGPDKNPYLAVETGSPVTVTPVGKYNDIALYIGSLDTYNGLSFTFNVGGSPVTFTGTELAGIDGSTTGGLQTGQAGYAYGNGLFTFTFADTIKSFTLTNTGSHPAFEIAEISGLNSVPEPASWALMLVGVGGIGGALRFQRRRSMIAA